MVELNIFSHNLMFEAHCTTFVVTLRPQSRCTGSVTDLVQTLIIVLLLYNLHCCTSVYGEKRCSSNFGPIQIAAGVATCNKWRSGVPCS